MEKQIREESERVRIMEINKFNSQKNQLYSKIKNEQLESQKQLLETSFDSSFKKDFISTLNESTQLIQESKIRIKQEEERLYLEEKKRKEEEEERKRKERERLEKERLENERLEKERLERERLEKEREEKERLEKEKLEKERLEKERLEKEKLEKEEKEKERLLKERLEKEKLEKEKQQQQQLQQQTTNVPQPTTGVLSTINNEGIMQLLPSSEYFISTLANQEFTQRNESLQQLKQFLTGYKLVSVDQQSHEKQLTKTINILINQISSSVEQVQQKSSLLTKILNEQRTTFNMNGDLYFYRHAIHTVINKVVGQVETQITYHPESAFPFAAVISNTSNQHPELMSNLIAEINQHCMYTVPMYVKKLQGISDMDYFLKMGFVSKNSVMETEEQFFIRMCGFISLFAAITQTPSAQNTFGIDQAWKWISRLVNMKPKRITSFLLVSFLQVAGHELLRTYKQQFAKILYLIASPPFFDALPEKSGCQASKERLKSILEQFFQRKTIDKPQNSVFM
eukprot:gene6008-7484_t